MAFYIAKGVDPNRFVDISEEEKIFYIEAKNRHEEKIYKIISKVLEAF